MEKEELTFQTPKIENFPALDDLFDLRTSKLLIEYSLKNSGVYVIIKKLLKEKFQKFFLK
jgi:hypothetical protein